MESTVPTQSGTSTVTSTAPPSEDNQFFYILEISLISAQDLAPVSKSMRTYAVAWILPNRKMTTRVDQQGHANPKWNDKFAFRLNDDLLVSEEAALTVEIYTVSWFRDVLVGSVSVPISNLINPPTQTVQNSPSNTRFIALQVRRASGAPQGILNMGVSLVDSTMRSMPLHSEVSHPNDGREKKMNDHQVEEGNHDQDEHNQDLNAKIQLWRSLSTGSDLNNDDFTQNPGSVCNGSMVNGSMVNGSELCSDIGPSASIVAAELAKKSEPHIMLAPIPRRRKPETEDTGGSILEELTLEEATAKGFRYTSRREMWRKEMTKNDKANKRHNRRNSDGGLFSCFGTAYGIEFTIVCGANNNSNKPNASKSRKKKANSDVQSA